MGLVPPDLGLPLRLQVNDASLAPGETLTLTVTTMPESTPLEMDLYVALQLPDQRVWFLHRDGSLTPAIQPYRSQWPVVPFRGELFRYTLTGAEPPGNYVWLAAFIDPGTGMIIGTIAQAPMTLAPRACDPEAPLAPRVLWGTRGRQYICRPVGRTHKLARRPGAGTARGQLRGGVPRPAAPGCQPGHPYSCVDRHSRRKRAALRRCFHRSCKRSP